MYKHASDLVRYIFSHKAAASYNGIDHELRIDIPDRYAIAMDCLKTDCCLYVIVPTTQADGMKSQMEK